MLLLRSLDILNRYSQQDERVLVITQENLGAGIARNAALHIAKGQYVMFLDADDWYPNPKSLALLYTKAVEHNVMICGGSFSEFKNGEVNSVYQGAASAYSFKKEGEILFENFQFDYGYIRFMYNLDFLRTYQIFFPDYRRFQDPPFLVKAMVCAKKFYAVPMIVYCYHKRQNRVKWSAQKINDVVKGLTDNLQISRDYRLQKLHSLCVQRLNEEYLSFIIKYITPNNLELLSLLIKANSIVDQTLISGDNINLDRPYLLKALQISVFEKKQITVNSNDFEEILNSNTYKIGVIVTWLPKKLRNIIKNIV